VPAESDTAGGARFGWYPNPKKSARIWVGVHDSDGLTSLVRDIETALEPFGIAKEYTTFAAHLTLARIKDPTPVGCIAGSHRKTGIGRSTELSTRRAFICIACQPGAAGSIYTKLSECRFQPA